MQEQNERAFSHLVESLYNPALSQSNQAAFNKERLQRVKDARRLRPQFLSVQIELPSSAQTLPVSGKTDELKYDTIVTGAITDGVGKQISFQRDDAGETFIEVGDDAGAEISLDAIAGKSLESAGANGIQPFSPFILRAYRKLKLQIYKNNNDPAETVSTVFCGSRVLSQALATDGYTPEYEQELIAEIERRVTPECRFAVVPVLFDTNGTATAKTPQNSEPRFIWGFRSTFSNALVNLGFNSNNAFASDYFPLWALAAEAGTNTENYRLLQSPIFADANEQLYFNFKNSIDGSRFAVDGQIELLETTL